MATRKRLVREGKCGGEWLSFVIASPAQIAANALELLRDAGNDSPPRTLIAAPTLIPRKSAVAWAP